jgi:hypothetical protein
VPGHKEMLIKDVLSEISKTDIHIFPGEYLGGPLSNLPSEGYKVLTPAKGCEQLRNATLAVGPRIRGRVIRQCHDGPVQLRHRQVSQQGLCADCPCRYRASR